MKLSSTEWWLTKGSWATFLCLIEATIRVEFSVPFALLICRARGIYYYR